MLWVDDEPSGNGNEIEAFEAVGVLVDTSASTEDALRKIDARGADGYAAIISDMVRPNDERAGFTLLDAVRRRGIATPLIIYSRTRDPQFRAQQATQMGVSGTPQTPEELFRLVTAFCKPRTTVSA